MRAELVERRAALFDRFLQRKDLRRGAGVTYEFN
jgi:hypothetical protein